jgi:hypothetical protein
MCVTPFGATIIERLVRVIAKRLIYDIEDNMLVGQSFPDKIKLIL